MVSFVGRTCSSNANQADRQAEDDSKTIPNPLQCFMKPFNASALRTHTMADSGEAGLCKNSGFASGNLIG